MTTDSLAASWEWALDAAGRAVDAGRHGGLPTAVAEEERHLLTRERVAVDRLLHELAASRGDPGDAWLPPRPVTPHLLGLPGDTRAVVLDLDGVLTRSDALHAAAWAEALDPMLLQTAQALGWQYVPFDRDEEYRLYLDGRPRREGIELFLASRGLRLQQDELHGLAQRKAAALEHDLRAHRLLALPGARRYLQAATHARLARGVVSASAATDAILARARIDHLVDVSIDAATMRARQLHARPAPDLLLEACVQLGVRPDEAVSLTHSGAGVVAALAAGLGVRGVAVGDQAERLRGFGAEVVVPSLATLLDPALRESAE